MNIAPQIAIMGACLVLWCIGTAVISPQGELRLVATQDVYNKERGTRTLVMGETAWVAGGYVYQSDTTDAVFINTRLLKLQIFTPRVHIDAGGLVATSPMPRRGTRLNWLARAQVHISKQVAIEFVHVSNGGMKGVRNPAIDSLGLSIRLR